MRHYLNVLGGVTTFTVFLYARRRRTWLMAALIATPMLLPPIAAYYQPDLKHESVKTFDALVNFMYVLTLAPLTALVYGCSLLSDEIEGKTLPFLLSRAAPRSAIVLGKFIAFCAVSIALLLVSLCFAYESFGIFLMMPLSQNVGLLLRYALLVSLALLSYGALCVSVSTITRRPVVVVALFTFGWEKLVAALPGYADFLTLQKYLQRMLPEVSFRRVEIEKVDLPPELMREVYPVGYTFSLLALLGATLVLLIAACLVVRSKEFATAADA